MKRIWLILSILTFLLAATAAVLWFGAPLVTGFTPQDGALDVPAGSPLRLSFSRRMQAASVEERLLIEPRQAGTFTWEGNTLIFVPQDGWPAGLEVRVRLTGGARAASWPALTTRAETTWVFTVRQPRLFYLYPANAAANLYVYDARSEQSAALTDFAAGILEYDVASDGGTVYYSFENNKGGSDIYRLPVSGDLQPGEPSLLLACGSAQCRAPRVAPQEDYLAYERSAPPGSSEPGYPQVWFVPLAKESAADGSILVRPAAPEARAGAELHQSLQPDWSSNGILSFYDTSQKAFIVFDPRSGQGTALPNQTGEPGSWRQGGKQYVAPEIFLDAGGSPQSTPGLQPVASSHLLQYNIETGVIDDLTGVEDLEDTAPAYSPDGKMLAFARKYLDIARWTPGRQLWLMQADATQPRQLTDNPDYNHSEFVWDAGGKQIAFVRFNQTAPADLPGIWVYNLERAFELELIPGGYSPHWVP